MGTVAEHQGGRWSKVLLIGGVATVVVLFFGQAIKNYYVPIVGAYIITAPVWLPPIIMVRRRRSSRRSLRSAVIVLAAATPIVALTGFAVGYDYCAGDVGIGGQGFVGTHWPNCPTAGVAWAAILAPAAMLCLLAWIGALGYPRVED